MYYPNPNQPVTPSGVTQPSRPVERLAQFQPVRLHRKRNYRLQAFFLAVLLVILAVAAVYFLTPTRTNILVLGVDRTPEGTAVGRTDTIILTTIIPLKPYVGMLSIPRDLWVPIRDVGENRINTAHFFAEANQPGSGPEAAIQVVKDNFGVKVSYYVRIRFDGFVDVIDAMGGVTLNLDKTMGGLDPGKHHLDGTQALAFVRDRKGTDDFFRMQQGQFLIRAVIRQMISPLSWPRVPGVILALSKVVDTNVPVWQWPRLGLAVLRAGSNGIDSQTLTREMVTPWTTDGGANVLLPNWDLILPLVRQMFG